ncbi:MAG: HAD-IIA family hydrolase [Sporichthyaceae bacterium]
MGDPLAVGSAPLVAAYDGALLDLDGVVYVGPHLVPHAAYALAQARDAGMRLAFVTNNAARTPHAVAEHLTRLGVPAQPSEVATSAQAAVRVIEGLIPPGSAVLVVGGEGLEVALRERGFVPVRSMAQAPVAVVQGFHPSVGWELLAEGAYAVGSGLPWVASNTDRTIPTPRGMAPGNGSLVEVIRLATGADPIVAGKPELALHSESIARVGALRPLVVGDRLDTDIEGAQRAGADSMLVLTGVTGAAELLRAAPAHRPTYLGADLRALLSAHPPIARAGGAAAVAGWHARAHQGRLALDGSGDFVEGLRAACVVAWEVLDEQGAGLDITPALAGLGRCAWPPRPGPRAVSSR